MKPLILALLSLMLAGCVGPPTTMRSFVVSGGKSVALPFSRSGALSSQTRDIKIEVTGFSVDGATAELTYSFAFLEKSRKVPMSVTVEDVTGPSAVILVTELFPTIDANGYWKGQSTPRRAGDPSLAWLSEAGDTVKIFRFTIRLNDGRTEEIHQASVWPGLAKPAIRKLIKL